MPMKPLAGVFLALACVLGIASTGCVFELAYGDPDLGVKTTSWILALAAPQVGNHQQLLVIDLDLENAATPPLVLINPEITAASAGLDTYEEGCLSIPGVDLDVVRPTAIEVSCRDEMGRPRKMKADGLMARCIQHEMDHLNGVLFVDRVTDEDGLQKELKEKGFERQHVRSVA